ncbi:serine acetyltransferase [Candidatus Bathyarchaeota archaeon]|nr:serine acetyltransferase [Candidatus Bathyarchaeota archaeon]
MIQSKEEYAFYLEADRIALNIQLKRPSLFKDEIWKYQRLLRKVEFVKNCGKSSISKIDLLQAWFRLRRLGIQLGFSIWPNVFGPGLSIAHRGPIVVHPEAKIGENCRIYQCVTIGSILPPGEQARYGYVTPSNMVPKIGNNVWFGPGVVVVGDIEIADGIAIGANSYVNKSFKEPNITIAGCPAKKISNNGSKYCWFQATEILRGGVS